MQGWALFLTGQMAAAKAAAEGHPLAPGSRGPAAGRLYALRALLAPFFPGEPDAETLARAGLEMLGTDDPIRALTLLALGTAQLAAGEWTSAVETLRQALEAARRSGQPMAVVAAATMLGLGLVATGARPEAETLCRGMLDASAGPRGREGAGSWYLARWLLGLVRYEAGDLVEARRELERGYAAAARFGFARQSLGALVSYLALARQATGSPEAALEAVRAVARDARAAGVARVAAQAAETEARIRLLQGDVPGAAEWADRPRSGTREGPASDPWQRPRDLTIARIRLAQSRPAEARSLLGAAKAAAEATNSVAELITIGVLDAAVAEGTGKRAAARRALEQAVRLASPGGTSSGSSTTARASPTSYRSRGRHRPRSSTRSSPRSTPAAVRQGPPPRESDASSGATRRVSSSRRSRPASSTSSGSWPRVRPTQRSQTGWRCRWARRNGMSATSARSSAPRTGPRRSCAPRSSDWYDTGLGRTHAERLSRRGKRRPTQCGQG